MLSEHGLYALLDPVQDCLQAALEPGRVEREGDETRQRRLRLLVGVSVRSPDAVMGLGFTVVFPLTFVAATFVPVAGLPSGLRQFAEWNPISALSAVARSQFGNPTGLPQHPAWPLAHAVVYGLFWIAAILAVCVPLTVHRYRARTSD